MRHILLFVLCLFASHAVCSDRSSLLIQSPDGRLSLEVCTEGTLSWRLSYLNQPVTKASPIGLAYRYKGKSYDFGRGVRAVKTERSEVNSSFATPFYKKARVEDCYRKALVTLNDGFRVEFRVYDDGAAYRILTPAKKALTVVDEVVEINFEQPGQAFIPYVNDNRGGERYCYSFESYYDEVPLREMYPDSLAITPLLVGLDNGVKAVVMEAGVENYPGMFLKLEKESREGLRGEFAPVPLEEEIGGHARLNLIPTRRADYIAQTEAGQALPWRVVLVTDNDASLANNDMTQRLAPACRLADTEWIKPGKVAWDWWNTCDLIGVDFEAGMNTPTYKKYIDFAAQYRLEYIIIDEGWSGKESLLEALNPDIDLEELVAYGKEKGVGVILWASWRNAAKETERVFAHYAAMGIKGFKVDFFDRDDQPLVASMQRIAECAGRHHLLLDLHGLKPNGLQRAYPNLVNFEGVKGLENAKWEPIVDGVPLHDFPRYDVTAPYLRQLAGPMDYTPGAMRNATRTDFRAINDHPMSQGTRAHQLAMYTLFEAPLQMLADSPSNYEKEPECTSFIASIPTTFDETVAIDGKIGEYLTLARRKGNVWYAASMTDWTARDFTLDLSFLGEGSYRAVILSDGVNAHRDGNDYRCERRTVTAADRLSLHLAPGGGWSAVFVKE